MLLHRAVKLLALLPNRDSRTLNGQDAGLRRFAAPRIEPSHDLCARQTPEEGRRARRGATGGSPAHLTFLTRLGLKSLRRLAQLTAAAHWRHDMT